MFQRKNNLLKKNAILSEQISCEKMGYCMYLLMSVLDTWVYMNTIYIIKNFVTKRLNFYFENLINFFLSESGIPSKAIWH